MIAHREGFGDILAEGTKRMAEKYNQGSEYYAIQVKDWSFLPTIPEEPRRTV